MPGLFVVTGDSRGAFAPLRGGRLTVGRSESCDLQVVDRAASRRHLELCLDAALATVWARDLGSRNGVRVNGHRIMGPEPLRDGDVLEVGGSKILFTLRENLERREVLAAFKQRGEQQRSTMVFTFHPAVQSDPASETPDASRRRSA